MWGKKAKKKCLFSLFFPFTPIKMHKNKKNCKLVNKIYVPKNNIDKIYKLVLQKSKPSYSYDDEKKSYGSQNAATQNYVFP